jgi:hypothetical protein
MGRQRVYRSEYTNHIHRRAIDELSDVHEYPIGKSNLFLDLKFGHLLAFSVPDTLAVLRLQVLAEFWESAGRNRPRKGQGGRSGQRICATFNKEESHSCMTCEY